MSLKKKYMKGVLVVHTTDLFLASWPAGLLCGMASPPAPIHGPQMVTLGLWAGECEEKTGQELVLQVLFPAEFHCYWVGTCNII